MTTAMACRPDAARLFYGDYTACTKLLRALRSQRFPAFTITTSTSPNTLAPRREYRRTGHATSSVASCTESTATLIRHDACPNYMYVFAALIVIFDRLQGDTTRDSQNTQTPSKPQRHLYGTVCLTMSVTAKVTLIFIQT